MVKDIGIDVKPPERECNDRIARSTVILELEGRFSLEKLLRLTKRPR